MLCMKLPVCIPQGGGLVLFGPGGDIGQREVDGSICIIPFDVESGHLVVVLYDSGCAALVAWHGLDEEELADVLPVDDDVKAACSASASKFHAVFPLALLGKLPKLSHDFHSLSALDASVAGDAKHVIVARATVDEPQRHLATTSSPIGSGSCSREVDRVGEGHVAAFDVELVLQSGKQTTDSKLIVLAQGDRYHLPRKVVYLDSSGLVPSVGARGRDRRCSVRAADLLFLARLHRRAARALVGGDAGHVEGALHGSKGLKSLQNFVAELVDLLVDRSVKAVDEAVVVFLQHVLELANRFTHHFPG
mmetsp:Transcript_33249/g.88356  ORF Transcript_33249/g.88356 Transcript_33249/m.88356 type:complete len:306 (+) Transcript_33249:976-1893(+)